jgi:hypothetical protein
LVETRRLAEDRLGEAEQMLRRIRTEIQRSADARRVDRQRDEGHAPMVSRGYFAPPAGLSAPARPSRAANPSRFETRSLREARRRSVATVFVVKPR